MKNDKDCKPAIEQAKENIDAVNARGNEAICDDALTFIDSLLTPDEISESNLRVALIGESIKAKN